MALAAILPIDAENVTIQMEPGFPAGRLSTKGTRRVPSHQPVVEAAGRRLTPPVTGLPGIVDPGRVAASGYPAGVHFILSILSGGVAPLRGAQPPADSRQASGLEFRRGLS